MCERFEAVVKNFRLPQMCPGFDSWTRRYIGKPSLLNTAPRGFPVIIKKIKKKNKTLFMS